MKMNSLKKENDFKNVFKKGEVFGNRTFVMYFLKNTFEKNRIGIIVSKKISKKAVVRNKIRRQMKEAYRLNEKNILTGYDIILIARESIKKTDYQKIEKSLMHLFYKKNLLKEKNGKNS